MKYKSSNEQQLQLLLSHGWTFLKCDLTYYITQIDVSVGHVVIVEWIDGSLALLDRSVQCDTSLPADWFVQAKSVDCGHRFLIELILRIFKIIITIFTIITPLRQPIIDLLRIVTLHGSHSLSVRSPALTYSQPSSFGIRSGWNGKCSTLDWPISLFTYWGMF